MIKNLVLTAAVLLALSNVAFAKFSDDYKAQYPKNVTVNNKQLPTGQFETETIYSLFEASTVEGFWEWKGTKLYVIDKNGSKNCVLMVTWNGRGWKNYDKVSWGDGTNAHELLPLKNPTRAVNNKTACYEALSTLINPTELKSAIIISAHRANGSNDITLNESHKNWAEWKKALDDAEKLMAE